MRISAGLKGFSGKIMRNARKETYFSPFRADANFRASERRAELFRAMPSAAENVKKRCMYINLFQNKTKPYISDGFEVQTIHS